MGVSRGSGNDQQPGIFERTMPTYHIQADNLSIRLLDFSQFHQEVPETRLCNHSVWCKYAHPVEFWRWVGLAGQMAANDLVFCETTCFNLLASVIKVILGELPKMHDSLRSCRGDPEQGPT
jgi:hypothetical protein